MTADPTTEERDALIESLARHRGFLLQTASGLTEDQARTASTVSSLTIASLLKHVADTEEGWARFAVEGASALGGDVDDSAWPAADGDGGGWVDTRFVLSDDETLPVLRQRIVDVAAQTNHLLRTADLSSTQALPKAPWFPPDVSWSVRRVALHILGEVSQHAGHADIIRETIDGARTMG